jgi:hypothetical protein
MGLLNPAALYLLAIVPALIVAYLARERPRQMVVSSVLALRALHLMRGERFGGRPRFRWPFFVELLILLLAALAAARPYFLHKGNPIAIVLDNSAAMQARMSDGKTRFEHAVSRLGDLLDRDTTATTVAIYVTTPQPHQLAPTSDNVGAALAELRRVAVTDAPADPAAVAGLLTQLLADRHLGRVIVASNRGIELPVPARIEPIIVAGSVSNFAIGSFALGGSSLGATAIHARVMVANFSPAAQILKVALTADGKPAGNAQTSVAAGDTANLDFPDIPQARVYQAYLTPDDAFPLDNSALAVSSMQRQVAILFVSPIAADGESLKLIPEVRVTTRTPQSYSPHDLRSADLVIFEYTAPKELPGVNTLLIMPPPDDSVFHFAVEPSSPLQVTGWPPTDPLTEGVNYRLLNLHSGEYFGQHPWMQPVVAGAHGGLILSGEREGHHYVAAGFNPLPYLGKRNLPMSVLTLNLLNYLAGLGAQSEGFRTGQPWLIPAGTTQVMLPSGRRIDVQTGQLFEDTAEQGLYRLAGSGSTTPRAVNLNDLSVSDLENSAPFRLQSSANGMNNGVQSIATNLTNYILGLIIALILLEALFVYRVRRPSLES